METFMGVNGKSANNGIGRNLEGVVVERYGKAARDGETVLDLGSGSGKGTFDLSIRALLS